MARFFVICQPGFEDELAQEILEFWPYLLGEDGRTHAEPLTDIKKIKGGLEFETSEMLGFQINFFSKLATRVLLRLEEFKALDFFVLEKRLKEAKLLDWIGESNFDISISSTSSKLGQEKKILATAQKVFGSRLVETSDLHVFLRAESDVFTLSLDTSGELLHLRGQKTLQGEAPLRSTLAARMLRELLRGFSFRELKKFHFVDPMAGSGTVLFEALNWAEPLRHRGFAFQKFKRGPKLLKTENLFANYLLPEFPLFAGMQAKDVAAEQIENFRQNLESLKKSMAAQRKSLDPAVIVGQTEDLFAPSAGQNSTEPCLLLTNPPYGERLQVPWSWGEFVGQIEKKYSPIRWGFVLPESLSAQTPRKTPAGKPLKKLLSFKNGGIPVHYYQIDTE